MPFLLTDAVLITCFFHPGVRRNMLSEKINDKIFSFVRSLMVGLAGQDVLEEWARHRIEPPRARESTEEIDIKMYKDFWSKTCYPNLLSAVIRIVEANPTEASCERAFCAAKFSFPRLGSSSSGDLVAASILGASALATLRNLKFESEDEEEEKQPRGERTTSTFTTLSGDAALLVLQIWESQQSTNEEPPRRRQPRGESYEAAQTPSHRQQ